MPQNGRVREHCPCPNLFTVTTIDSYPFLLLKRKEKNFFFLHPFLQLSYMADDDRLLITFIWTFHFSFLFFFFFSTFTTNTLDSCENICEIDYGSRIFMLFD